MHSAPRNPLDSALLFRGGVGPNNQAGFGALRFSKAIETPFCGYRFRSRLEARWAVVWQTLGLRWCYEHEGYALKDGPYLPDFWFPAPIRLHVEIKPLGGPSIVEMERCEDLARVTGQPVALVAGNPWVGEHRVWLYGQERRRSGVITVPRRCHGLAIVHSDGEWGTWYCASPDCRCWEASRDPVADDPRIVEAFTAARQARFGERGEAHAA